PGVGTRTPEQVAAALISAVQRNRAEVEVAPATLRVGATIAGAAPGLAATAQRLLGGTKIGSDFARVQRSRQ
ncbi:MAG: oxidoreductase, partial [Solirubrobacterales bacterium]|nr:oxidoreductase [Solirubrobacterales bacterium]